MIFKKWWVLNLGLVFSLSCAQAFNPEPPDIVFSDPNTWGEGSGAKAYVNSLYLVTNPSDDKQVSQILCVRNSNPDISSHPELWNQISIALYGTGTLVSKEGDNGLKDHESFTWSTVPGEGTYQKPVQNPLTKKYTMEDLTCRDFQISAYKWSISSNPTGDLLPEDRIGAELSKDCVLKIQPGAYHAIMISIVPTFAQNSTGGFRKTYECYL